MCSARPCEWTDTRCSKTGNPRLVLTAGVLLFFATLTARLAADDPPDSGGSSGSRSSLRPEEAAALGELLDTLGEEKKPEPKQNEDAAAPAKADKAAPKAKPKPPKIVLLSTPDDAVRAAAADLQALQDAAEENKTPGAFDATAYRYVWVPDGNPEDLALVSFVLNAVVSRSDINYTPNKPGSPIQFLDNNRLVRLNLGVLCPLNRGKDLLDVQAVWDKMFNPYFLLEKQEAAKPIVQDPPPQEEKKTVTRRVPAEPYVAKDGKTYDYRVVEVEVDADGEEIEKKVEQKLFDKDAVFGPHVDVDAGASLKSLTASRNPIVWCHTLYQQALTTADGGLYYEFMGIRKASESENGKDKSDQAFWLESLGVSEELVDRLRADQRAAMTRSNVTAKPRRLDVFNRPSRSSNNQGIITITQDMFDADYDVAADPLMNLLEFKVSGREVVFERNNGHLGYILFDGKGQLVDEAPPQLVSDHTIPAPHTSRLQCAISCIRCHGKGEDQGWKPFENHIRQALNGFLNVYNDRQGEADKLTLPETLEKLARLYAADLSKPFRRAREDHTDAIVRCTAGVINNDDGSPWSFREISEALADRFVYYTYSPVTPTKACLEMGFKVDDEETAVTLLNRLLGFLAPDGDTEIVAEDVRLGMLKMNIPINRFQWELVYADAMSRASVNAAQADELIKDEPPPENGPEKK